MAHAEGKIPLRYTIKVTAFPTSLHVKTGEHVSIYIKVNHRGFEDIMISGGQKDSKGIVTPNRLDVEGSLYKGGDGNYEETQSVSGFSKYVIDGGPRIKLKPRSSVVYKIEGIPFKIGSEGNFCKLKFTLYAQREDKSVELLTTNLILLREGREKGKPTNK